LLDFCNSIDISPKKDKSLLKDIETEGSGFDKPNPLASVKVHYKLETADGTVITNAESGEPVVVTIDDGDIFPGFDLALKSMKKGESATFKIDAKHAFGVTGNAALGVPAGASLTASITVVDFTNPKMSYSLQSEEKIKSAEDYKTQGNALFQAGRYKQAVAR
jgi:FKBP-type peptidyl-prolyl cis-trans isomerase